MDKLPESLEQLYGQHAQKTLFLEALSHARDDAGREWEVTKRALAGKRWVFGSNGYLDDTADTYFVCHFQESDGGREKLLSVLAGILTRQASDAAFSVPIRRIEQDGQNYNLILSFAAAMNLSKHIKSMRLEGIEIEAGRADTDFPNGSSR